MSRFCTYFMDFYSKSISQVLEEVNSSKDGLSDKAAEKRLNFFGPNTLPSSGEISSRVKIFFDQFTSPLILILLIAGVVSGLVGEVLDMTVIFITVAMNTVVGFIQEDKANESLKKLHQMIESKALVLRAGKKEYISSKLVVQGDILILEAGDKIQADGRIIEAVDCEVDESSLTGESEPVSKHKNKIAEKTNMADRKNMLHRGTIILNGRAVIVVTETGSKTQIGKIASLVKETKEDKTPLQIQLGRLSKYIAIIVVSISSLIFLFGIFTTKIHHSVVEMFEIAVVLAVAAIPEGMAITLTVILAVGMRNILKRKALVRRLVAAETLGSVNVICTDKTGTITEGKMRVTQIITENDHLDFDKIKSLSAEKPGKHEDAVFAIKIGVIANDAVSLPANDQRAHIEFVGDSTDSAFLYAGLNIGYTKESLESSMKKIDEIPFSSERKYIAKLENIDHEYITYIKGAPEILLSKSGFFEKDGKAQKMTAKQIGFFEEKHRKLTEKGLRVIALAYKQSAKKQDKLSDNQIENLVFVGLAALSDPIRAEVSQTISLAHTAGIKTVMITGDHVKTAQSIAKQIGLSHNINNIFDGQQLEHMSDVELRSAVKNVSIFARVDPVHKIRIVRAFQANGDVVAMTGDGVNDAPAIKAADIGVALGSGTDVAKESADIVLMNNAYSTIVSSVEEGRGIYQNIKKVVLYLLSGSFAEVILIAASLVLGMPLAVLPAQILWVNIVEDAFPNMALAFDESEKENMKKNPRKKNEPIIDKEMKYMIAIITIVSNIVLLGLFIYFYKTTGNIELTRTIIFVGLGIDSLLYIYSVRSMRYHIWQMNLFGNKYLNYSLLFGWLLLIGAVHLPILQTLLRTVPLSINYWLVLLLFGLLNITLIEIVKGIFIVKERKIV